MAFAVVDTSVTHAELIDVNLILPTVEPDLVKCFGVVSKLALVVIGVLILDLVAACVVVLVT